MIEMFQDVYLEQNKDLPDVAKYPADTVWTLSIKLIDLNTNLHNPNVKPMLRYTKETFVNLSMQLLKQTFSKGQLEDMYDNILMKKFEHNVNLNEKHFKRINEMVYSIVLHDVKNNDFKKSESQTMAKKKDFSSKHNL